MSNNRIKERLDRAASRGAGSAYASAQQISRGLSDEEAEKAAEQARNLADEDLDEMFGGAKESDPEKEKELPPPDKEEPSEEEVETAKSVMELLKNDNAPKLRSMKPDEDPLTDNAGVIRLRAEKDLEPISIREMMFKNYVTQDVTIIDDIEATLRSLQGYHYALVDRWVLQKFGATSPLEKAKMQRYTIVALSILTIDGTVPGGITLPSDKESGHNTNVLSRDQREWFDVFENRLNWLMQKNTALIDLLNMHVTWFIQRVRRVFGDHAYQAQEIKKS